MQTLTERLGRDWSLVDGPVPGILLPSTFNQITVASGRHQLSTSLARMFVAVPGLVSQGRVRRRTNHAGAKGSEPTASNGWRLVRP